MAEVRSVADARVARNRNFTEDERLLLSELIKNHPSIEDKGYDCNTLGKKKKEWEIIHQEFTSFFSGRCIRSISQLKGCWKRLKIEARKEANKNRRAACLTGGGPPPSPINNIAQMTLSVIGDSIQPLENPVDPPSPLHNITKENIDLLTSSDGQLTCDSGNNIESTISEPAKDNPSRKRKRLSAIKTAQLEILKEILEAEKTRLQAEKVRLEILQLKKWKLMQECRENYGLPPDFPV